VSTEGFDCATGARLAAACWATGAGVEGAGVGAAAALVVTGWLTGAGLLTA
jgi:hypothetical protein